jgi:hypothetical protein
MLCLNLNFKFENNDFEMRALETLRSELICCVNVVCICKRMGYISKKTELNLGDELVPTLSNPSNCWELSLGRW